MLNPEVERFPPPESHIQYSHHRHIHQNNPHHLVQQQPFNTQVSVLLPECVRVPPELSSVLTHDTQFYHISALPLHHLCTPTFNQAFINTGEVYALSCDTRLDVDNSAAITPDGKLHLIVGKLTYQELPLSGHPSHHILRSPRNKYVVEADLKERCCDERVSNALKQVDLVFNWWLSWMPHDPDVCPSSIAKYFHDLGFEVREEQAKLRWNVVSEALMPILAKPQVQQEEEEEEGLQVVGEGQKSEQNAIEGEDGMQVELEGQKAKQKATIREDRMKTEVEEQKAKQKSREEEMYIATEGQETKQNPKGDEEGIYIALEGQEAEQKSREKDSKMYIDIKGQEARQVERREEVDEMDPEEVLEWIGCQTLGINLLGEGSTVCDIDAPHPSAHVTNLCSAHFSGLFIPAVIMRLLHKLREWLDMQSDVCVPWLSVTVYGHPDSPVAWGCREHRYTTNGDNFYTLIITREEVRSFKVSGPRRPSRLYVKANKNK